MNGTCVPYTTLSVEVTNLCTSTMKQKGANFSGHSGNVDPTVHQALGGGHHSRSSSSLNGVFQAGDNALVHVKGPGVPHRVLLPLSRNEVP